jgi:protein TonB
MASQPARDVARALCGLALGVLVLAAAPASSAAQDLYLPSQLTQAPKVASMEETARLISGSYPEHLRTQGIGGTVQLQFIVGPDGKVEPSSIEILSSTVTELGEAAKKVVEKLEFSPPKVKNDAVRVTVKLPIVYRPG